MKKTKTTAIVSILLLILIGSTSSLSYSFTSNDFDSGGKEAVLFKDYPKVQNSEISETDINKILGIDKKVLAPEEKESIENFKSLLIENIRETKLK